MKNNKIHFTRLLLVLALSLTGFNGMCPKSDKNFDAYPAVDYVTNLTQQAKDHKFPAYVSALTYMYGPFQKLQEAIGKDKGPDRADNIVLIGEPSIDVVAPVQALAEVLQSTGDQSEVLQINLTKINEIATKDGFSKKDYFNFIEQKILQHYKGDPIYFIDDIEQHSKHAAAGVHEDKWVAYEQKGNYEISIAELAEFFVKYDKRIIYTVSEPAYLAFFKKHELATTVAQGSATDSIAMTKLTVSELDLLLSAQARQYKSANNVDVTAESVEQIARLTRAFLPSKPPLKTGLAALEQVYLDAKKSASKTSDENMVLKTFAMKSFADRAPGELKNSKAFKTDSARDIEASLQNDGETYLEAHRLEKYKQAIYNDVDALMKKYDDAIRAHNAQEAVKLLAEVFSKVDGATEDQKRTLYRIIFGATNFSPADIKRDIAALKVEVNNWHGISTSLLTTIRERQQESAALDPQIAAAHGEVVAKQAVVIRIDREVATAENAKTAAERQLSDVQAQIRTNEQEIARLKGLPLDPSYSKQQQRVDDIKRLESENKKSTIRTLVAIQKKIELRISQLAAARAKKSAAGAELVEAQLEHGRLVNAKRDVDDAVIELQAQQGDFAQRLTDDEGEINRLNTRLAFIESHPGILAELTNINQSVVDVKTELANVERRLNTTLGDVNKALGKLGGANATTIAEGIAQLGNKLRTVQEGIDKHNEHLKLEILPGLNETEKHLNNVAKAVRAGNTKLAGDITRGLDAYVTGLDLLEQGLKNGNKHFGVLRATLGLLNQDLKGLDGYVKGDIVTSVDMLSTALTNVSERFEATGDIGRSMSGLNAALKEKVLDSINAVTKRLDEGDVYQALKELDRVENEQLLFLNTIKNNADDTKAFANEMHKVISSTKDLFETRIKPMLVNNKADVEGLMTLIAQNNLRVLSATEDMNANIVSTQNLIGAIDKFPREIAKVYTHITTLVKGVALTTDQEKQFRSAATGILTAAYGKLKAIVETTPLSREQEEEFKAATAELVERNVDTFKTIISKAKMMPEQETAIKRLAEKSVADVVTAVSGIISSSSSAELNDEQKRTVGGALSTVQGAMVAAVVNEIGNGALTAEQMASVGNATKVLIDGVAKTLVLKVEEGHSIDDAEFKEALDKHAKKVLQDLVKHAQNGTLSREVVERLVDELTKK